MALVVLIASFLSLNLMVRGVLGVPIEGSIALFFRRRGAGLFATTSMGIFIATLARNMPQFGMLMMLTIMPLQMLSGGTTPRESMPDRAEHHAVAHHPFRGIEPGHFSLPGCGPGDGVAALPGAGPDRHGAVFPVVGRFRKTIGQMA